MMTIRVVVAIQTDAVLVESKRHRTTVVRLIGLEQLQCLASPLSLHIRVQSLAHEALESVDEVAACALRYRRPFALIEQLDQMLILDFLLLFMHQILLVLVVVGV